MSNSLLMQLQAALIEHETMVGPFCEGLRDAERYLVKPEEGPTKASVHEHIDTLQRRLDLVDVAKRALATLDEDGFSEIPDLVLAADQYLVWQANHDTHQAAVARTKALPEPATGAAFTLGIARPKPDAPPQKP